MRCLKTNELRMLDIRFDPRRPGVPIYSVRHVSLDALDIIHMVKRRVQLVRNGATSINAAATE